ncbi:MAG: hypothetical protein NZL99_08780 [Burkholderiaceae bacterium]|nr:hypothetical protein [Burkholderiaceae bacterium]
MRKLAIAFFLATDEDAMLDQLLKGALQGLAGNQGSGQALLQLAASLLSSNGQFGGIAGLIQQFQACRPRRADAVVDFHRPEPAHLAAAARAGVRR